VSVGRIIIGLLWLVSLLAVVAFAVWNPGQQLNVRVFNQVYERVPFVYTVFIAFLAGVVLTLLFWFLYYIETALAMRRLRRERRDLAEELTALRNLPVEEDLPGTSPTESGD